MKKQAEPTRQMVITSATLLKNLGSGTQSMTQNLAREKRLVVPMLGKKKGSGILFQCAYF
jgi:hypothetical protein